MEIPLELMLTIRQKPPWMFFPDIIPIGHPIFDIINSTNPEVIRPCSYSVTLMTVCSSLVFPETDAASAIFL